MLCSEFYSLGDGDFLEEWPYLCFREFILMVTWRWKQKTVPPGKSTTNFPGRKWGGSEVRKWSIVRKHQRGPISYIWGFAGWLAEGVWDGDPSTRTLSLILVDRCVVIAADTYGSVYLAPCVFYWNKWHLFFFSENSLTTYFKGDIIIFPIIFPPWRYPIGPGISPVTIIEFQATGSI